MSKKIITTFLSLSLFIGHSGIFAAENDQKTSRADTVQTVQDEQAKKEREKALIKQANILHQQLVQGKVTEEQLLESIYVWRDGVKDDQTGKIVRQITQEEANLLIHALDLQGLHEEKETIKALMMLKAQVDQGKISKQWFKRRVLKVLSIMRHKGIMSGGELKKLKQKLGLTSISERLCDSLNKALKISLVIGAAHYLTKLISSSSERLPRLIGALKTGEVTMPVDKYFVRRTPDVFREVVNYGVFKIDFWDKVAMVAKFIFGVNESASGTLNRTVSALH